jgi:hypothetical protein
MNYALWIVLKYTDNSGLSSTKISKCVISLRCIEESPVLANLIEMLLDPRARWTKIDARDILSSAEKNQRSFLRKRIIIYSKWSHQHLEK